MRWTLGGGGGGGGGDGFTWLHRHTHTRQCYVICKHVQVQCIGQLRTHNSVVCKPGCILNYIHVVCGCVHMSMTRVKTDLYFTYKATNACILLVLVRGWHGLRSYSLHMCACHLID